MSINRTNPNGLPNAPAVVDTVSVRKYLHKEQLTAQERIEAEKQREEEERLTKENPGTYDIQGEDH